jgi:peptide/nickel transport system substrate-binding protein
MYKFARLVSLSLILILAMSVGLGMVSAQDEEGEGGILHTATFGSGPANVSPIYCQGTDCADDLYYNMFLGLVGVDPATATIQPEQPDAFAWNWDVSDDNLVYTLHLRDDFTWSDGTPITSADMAYHWEVLNSIEANHPQAWVLDDIASFEVIDDYTVQFTMNTPACTAIATVSQVFPVPAHVLSEIPMAELEENPWNQNPTPNSGPFNMGEFRAGEAVTLVGRDDYVDAPLGYVAADGLIQSVVGDQTVLIEQLLEGDINFVNSVAVDRQDEVKDRDVSEGGDLQAYSYPGTSWDYMAMNFADPNNPQPALDADGNRVDQGLHPIFGDKLVRQAIGHAVDVDAIIQGAVFGNGDRMTSNLVQASWAYNSDLPPVSYDPDLALSMLADAGWVPDSNGRLVCQGCLYATEVDSTFEGSPLEFTLNTNTGNTRREAIGAVIQDQLDEIGITVNFESSEFNTLIQLFSGQTYDAFILGWRAGYPDDPDGTQLWSAAADDPEVGGYNFTSFYNEEYFALEEQAKSVPGCAPEDRAPFYLQMQEIIQDEMPYLWLFSTNGMYVAREEVHNFAPFPNNYRWNVTNWFVSDQ